MSAGRFKPLVQLLIFMAVLTLPLLWSLSVLLKIPVDKQEYLALLVLLLAIEFFPRPPVVVLSTGSRDSRNEVSGYV